MRAARRRATSAFDSRGQRSTPLAGDQQHLVLVAAHDRRPALTSLATIQSQPLRASLARAWASRSSVSAAKPTTSCGRCGPRRRERGQDVGVLDQPSVGRAVLALLQLDAERLVGAPVGHGGDADGGVGRQGGPGRRPASRARSPHRPGARPAAPAGRWGRRPGSPRRPARARARRWRSPACRWSGWSAPAPGRSARPSGPAVTSARLPASGPAPAAPSAAIDRLEDRRRLGHPAGAELAAGHGALVGPDEGDAVGLQPRQVALGRRRAATCARSSPAPSAPACRWPAAWSRRGRRPGRAPPWPSGRRWPARPPPGRPSATARCGPSRASSVRREELGIDLVLGQSAASDSGVTNSAPARGQDRAHARRPALRNRRVSSSAL